MKNYSWQRRTLSVAAAALASSASLAAQTAAPDSARCDSIVASAGVDVVRTGIFVSITRTDAWLDPHRADFIAGTIGASLIPPKPLRLSVFAGPARMRSFHPMPGDTAASLRAPTLTGVYRFVSNRDGTIRSIATVRASLIVGFDSAAMQAVRDAGVPNDVFTAPDGEDSMRVDVRFSTDSAGSAQQIFASAFPRLRVVDAVPLRSNPPAEFPEDAKRDSLTAGEVVLRFVVDRTGKPALETLEVVRATATSFVRSALTALLQQSFEPATVHGCAVAQVVDYPFSFVQPTSPDERSTRVEKLLRH